MYTNAELVCPSKEEIITRLSKQLKVDRAFIKAIDNFTTLHGAYTLRDVIG